MNKLKVRLAELQSELKKKEEEKEKLQEEVQGLRQTNDKVKP